MWKDIILRLLILFEAICFVAMQFSLHIFGVCKLLFVTLHVVNKKSMIVLVNL